MTKKYNLLTYFQALSYFAIICSLLVIYLNYVNLKSEFAFRIATEKKAEAIMLSNQVSDIFSYVENFTHIIGSRIAQVGAGNKKEIAEILQEITKKIDGDKNIFTWTFFDFITPDGKVIATSKDGLIKEEIFITKEKRSWMIEAPKDPWKLHVAKSDIGIVSGENIIPCGFAITDKKNNVIGLVTLGISVKKLKKKTEEVITDHIISFAILNSDNSVIFSSQNFDQDDLSHQIESDHRDPVFNGFFELNGKQYYRTFLKTNKNLSVIVGVNKKDANTELFSQLLPKITNTVFLTFLFLILLYFIKTILLRPVSSLANCAKQISAGKFDVVLPDTKINEIDILTNSIDVVRNFLIKDERAKNDLIAASDKIKKLSEEKAMLTKSFTDELQNMLSRIVGLTQIIKTNLKGKILLGHKSFDIHDVLVNERHASDIAKLSSEITDLIEDLFLMTKSERHIAVFEQEVVDLKTLLFGAIKILKGKAIDHNKIIRVNVPAHSTNSEFVATNVDPVRTKQVFFNIINKAIKSDLNNHDIDIAINRLSEDETIKINKVIKENLRINNEIDSQKKTYLYGLLNQKRTRVQIVISNIQSEFGVANDMVKKTYGFNRSKIMDRVEIIDMQTELMKYIIEFQGGLFERIVDPKREDSAMIKIVL